MNLHVFCSGQEHMSVSYKMDVDSTGEGEACLEPCWVLERQQFANRDCVQRATGN